MRRSTAARAPRCSAKASRWRGTCVTVPSLNVAFDIGRWPLFAVRQDYLFITHAHLDHIVSTMHLSEIMEHSQWFRNKAIILTNFSNGYSLEDIRQAVSRLQPKLCSKVVALTEGFKSEHR